MSHLYRLEDTHLTRPSLVTIGVFDGLHKGHQALIQRVVEAAHAADHNAIVLTFHPHPDVILRGIEGRYYLTTPEQRARLMMDMGVNMVVTYPFDDTVRHMRAAHFVDKLVKHLNMKMLWVGEEFALGYQREGNVDFLREYGAKKDYTVEAMPLVVQHSGKDVVSSSRIRDLLAEGDLTTVREWLARAYAVCGTVIQGDQRGRTIGFPTANLDVGGQQIIPANGVYAGWARFEGETHMAVTNVGVRPTFDGQNVTVEAHLLDFDRDIYDIEVELSFIKRLRGEMKFDGIGALIAQIKDDARIAREFLEQDV